MSERVEYCETIDVVNGHPIIEYGRRIPLYRGDPKCHHEIVGGDNMSGIKCRKCNGWYCAC